jgi:fused signal recognition particle receptor
MHRNTVDTSESARMNMLARLKEGLAKTRRQITGIVGGGGQFDEGFYGALEEALVSADIGIDLSTHYIEALKETVNRVKPQSNREAYALLKEMLAADLSVNRLPDDFPPKPWVILIVGVNGVGKTTTIGKLAKLYAEKGKKVILGAADTFRAGAIEQLRIWAERSGADIVSQHEGADAASVAFDTMEAAKSRSADVVILDTAGRLHNKVNLMNELDKIVRVMKKNIPTAPNEVLLVVDATTGQNALKQTEVFNEIIGITGFVITKLDGTAKGGIALALAKKFGIPVRKIGVGEAIEDFQDFEPRGYVDAMFGELE